MRRLLPYLLFLTCMFLCNIAAKATHVVGADLYYTWITGNQYKVTVIIYGDCGPASSSSFALLPTATPQVCVFDGSTSVTSLSLSIQAPSTGTEITPVCPADSLNTQCHGGTIPGIKKFVYSKTYTLPYASANWKFVFTGSLGTASSAGRAAALTNLPTIPATTMCLVATLNNSTTFNSNPILTILPVPFFCISANDSYNPGAVDADGDSLTFALTPASNYTGTGCSASSISACNYVTTYPYSGANPLHTFAGTFSFDPATGQIGFVPDILQRSVVVYTISEWRNGVLMGTMQREMSFTVLNCTTPAPTGVLVLGSATNGTVDDTAHFHICAENGPFSMNMNVTSTDPALNLTVSNTGVPPGCVVSVLNNGTPNPNVTISWTSTGVTPGSYTFFLNFRDDACPINGQQTRAFTINIYPVPNVNYTIIDTNNCAHAAVVSISPGGAGTPWTVKTVDATGAAFDSSVLVTTAYLDTFGTGNDTLIIYNAGSPMCNSRVPMTIAPPIFVTPSGTHINPSYCGMNDGSITITGLNSLEADTLYYTYNGTPMSRPIFTSSTGTYTLNNLCAGTYSNVYVEFGSCVSPAIGPFVLITPPFTISRLEITNPTACGLNDGSIKIRGVHPGQLDTVRYTRDGVAQPPYYIYVGSDSTIILNNLDSAIYSNIVVNTTGVCPNAVGCTSNSLGPVVLQDVRLVAGFTFETHLGCDGDTVIFTNTSTPSASTIPLTYRWYFGDGGTDTSKNPTHIYHHGTAVTYNIKMFFTNGHCIDSALSTVSFQEPVHANFVSSPDTYICQGAAVAFRDTSVGSGLTWNWSFGDGGTATDKDPIHTFVNTGTYVVTLISTDNIPCKDTVTKVVQVDSTSVVSMTASDTVICRGGLVTFTGTYTDIGLTGVTWSFGDGTGYVNANPIQHSFDATGWLPITMTVTYRACATVVTTRNIKVYDNPTLYLGPDTALCPGGDAIELYDLINAGNPLASWLWNTGETTPNILVDKPGYYSATVTLNGCINTDTVWVANDCYVSFPNIFTPNGDGVNDYFFPRNLLSRGLVAFKMDIYNRWGQKIYSTTSTEGQGWDGRFNGEMQPQGVFIYQIDAVFKDGQKLSRNGNVTLMR